MHTNHQHFLIVGTIKDANAATFRQPTGCAPEKIMLHLLRAGLFETENLTPGWVDSGQDVSDGAIFAGRVHPLKDQQR